MLSPAGVLMAHTDQVRLDEIIPIFFRVASVEKSERPEDPSGLEMKISHGIRSGSTLRKIPHDTA